MADSSQRVPKFGLGLSTLFLESGESSLEVSRLVVLMIESIENPPDACLDIGNILTRMYSFFPEYIFKIFFVKMIMTLLHNNKRELSGNQIKKNHFKFMKSN